MRLRRGALAIVMGLAGVACNPPAPVGATGSVFTPTVAMSDDADEGRIIGADTGAIDAAIARLVERRLGPTVAAADGTWAAHRESVRQTALREVYTAGLPASWQTPTRVEWLDVLSSDADVEVRAFRFEALPGLWLHGLQHRPQRRVGRLPVVINFNGHSDAGQLGHREQQERAIEQARRGALALTVEFIGYGPSAAGGLRNRHSRLAHLELVGVNGAAPLVQAARRAVDIAAGHADADPARIAVTGVSGGAWQSIVVAALDDRVSAIHAVAGFADNDARAWHDEDAGDHEQSSFRSGLSARGVDVVALLAGRPTILAFHDDDPCCFAADRVLPGLSPAVRLAATSHPDVPFTVDVSGAGGGHRYHGGHRATHLALLHDIWGFAHPAVMAPLRKPPILPPARFAFPPLRDQTTLHQLARDLASSIPRATVPTSPDLEDVLATRRRNLTSVLGLDGFTRQGTLAGDVVHTDVEGLLSRSALRNGTGGVVIRLGDKQEQQTTADERTVVAFEPVLTGTRTGRNAASHALRLGSVGVRAVALQVAELQAVIDAVAGRGPIEVHATGRRHAFIALVLAAADERVAAVTLEESLTSLRQLLEENGTFASAPELYAFDGLRQFDVPGLTMLVAPRRLRVVDPTTRMQALLAEVEPLFVARGGISPLER